MPQRWPGWAYSFQKGTLECSAEQARHALPGTARSVRAGDGAAPVTSPGWLTAPLHRPQGMPSDDRPGASFAERSYAL